MPPTNIDGSEITGATIDGQEVSEITADGDVVFTAAPDIPDTQINRTADDTSASSVSPKFGIEITLSDPVDGFKADISANNSGFTTAYITETDGTILNSTDISSLSPGDTFSIAQELSGGGRTVFLVLDAGGSNFTIGWYDSPSFPYDGAGFDVTNSVGQDTSTRSDRFYSFNNIRNLNF